MIATSHVIIGGAAGIAAGTITKNPAIALAVGIVSHFLCDMIPHLDAPLKIEYENGEYDRPVWTKKFISFAVSDSLFAFLLGLLLWYKYFGLNLNSVFAWAAVGAYLPDFVDNVPLWSKKIRTLPGFKQFHEIHLAAHNIWRFKFPMPEYWFLGTATQIIFIIPCLWLIIK
ncbi:MAG TPA: hypothetical protein VF974_06380 [Patescibacteria group bacterium]